MSLTALTDYALALVTAALGAMLIVRAAGAPRRLWGWAFIALAAAGILGGTYHGFEHEIDATTLGWLWLANEWTIGLFGLGAVAASTLAAFAGAARRGLLALTGIVFLAFAAWTWGHDLFRYVLAYNVWAMAFVLAVHLTRLRRHAATPWIVSGIAASALAAAAQASGIAIGPFDHNVIFHLIQLAAMLLLFGGARRLGAAPSTMPSSSPK